ncbi:hypothetical protein RR46_07287 [Papilio xuthus]|uniref:Uncharacterized protein n=1 Tax=Papilio xuthus TaxID=66420 RepID=A0A194Q2A8_PAPXU|nr:hypothetical protein RR46_07287 [Papilio xuthus]
MAPAASVVVCRMNNESVMQAYFGATEGGTNLAAYRPFQTLHPTSFIRNRTLIAMIYTVFLIILFPILGTYGSKPVLKMPSQSTEKFMAAATHCIKETGAPEDCLTLSLPWKLPQNELTEKYLYCLGQTTKLAKSDGHYYPEKVMKLFAGSDIKEDIEKIMNRTPPAAESHDSNNQWPGLQRQEPSNDACGF